MSTSFKPFGGLGSSSEGSPAPSGKPVRKSTKTADKPLEELYSIIAEKGKATPSVRNAIIAKEDFSGVNKRYCDAVCGLCKSSRRPSRVQIKSQPVDILIVQDFNAPDDKWKSGEQIERIYRTMIGHLAAKHFQGLSYAVVSSLKCTPGEPDLKSQSVTITKMKPCAPYLLKEIETSQPKAIIVLGSNSCKVLDLKLSNTGNRGEVHRYNDIPVVVTLHPRVTTMIRQNASGKMWGPDYFEVIDRDFLKAARIARGDLVVPTLEEGIEMAKQNIWVTKSLGEVREAIDLLMSLPENKVISYDLETTSLDPWAPEAKILTAQFGYRDVNGTFRAIVVPLWHREQSWYNADEAWPYIAKLLLRPCPKVGHNLKFDIIYTFVQKGVRVVNARFDTLLLLHAINSGLKGNYGLKRAVWDWIPETGLGGYEDRLPKLSKVIDEDESEEDEVEEVTEA